jgi:hypothetical protein
MAGKDPALEAPERVTTGLDYPPPTAKRAVVPASALTVPPPTKSAEELLRENRKFHVGVVAFLDVLGTRSIHSDAELSGEVERRVRVQSEFAADPYTRVWTGIFQLMEAFLPTKDKITDADREINRRAVAFSDSIVITAWRDERPQELVERIASEIAPRILSAIRSGVFLRGAISFGQFYSDEYGLILGPAAIDAVEWAEQAEWVGVQLTPSAHYAWKTSPSRTEGATSVIRPYNVPLKGEREKFVPLAAVDWARESRADPVSLKALARELMLVFSTRPISPKDEVKYRNTLAFVEGASP